MRAMILAAGRGERMRPLTDHCPKPLVPVGGKPLIVWHLEKLARAGFDTVVINTAWLGEQLPQHLGDGSTWGLRIHWSHEGTALETAGGVAQALHWLGTAPFFLVSADIWSTWDYAEAARLIAAGGGADAPLAHLLMVPNPDFHPTGDFDAHAFAWAPLAPPDTVQRVTYGNMGVFSPALFDGITPGSYHKLGPLLHAAIARRQVQAQWWDQAWYNIGTRQQRDDLEADLDRLLG